MNYPAYPTYKESGVAWLGKVPEHWEVKKIKHNSLVKARVGWQNLRSEEFTDEGSYCVTGTDFTNGRIDWDKSYHVSEARYLVDPNIQLKVGDLLVTKDGSIGKLAIVDILPDKACLNAGVFVVRPSKNNYNSRLLYWVLDSKVFRSFIDLNSGGSTIVHLYQNVFELFAFALPPLSEQTTIVDFLDRETGRIDTLVEKKRRLIALLKEKRSALISRTVTRGLPTEAARELGLEPHTHFKDSGIEWLGKVPDGWEVKALRYVLLNQDYRRIPIAAVDRSDMEKVYPYYGASGIIDYVDNFIFYETLILVAEDGANLLSRSTPLAFLATGKYWVNNHAHILKLKKGDIRYWEGVLQTYDYTPLITGAAQPKLTADRLGSIVLPVPPIPEQTAIATYLDRETAKIDKLIGKVEEAIERLQEYRAALITAAVTGKIDVRYVAQSDGQYKHAAEEGEVYG